VTVDEQLRLQLQQVCDGEAPRRRVLGVLHALAVEALQAPRRQAPAVVPRRERERKQRAKRRKKRNRSARKKRRKEREAAAAAATRAPLAAHTHSDVPAAQSQVRRPAEADTS
jgi:hypothetical protein